MHRHDGQKWLVGAQRELDFSGSPELLSGVFGFCSLSSQGLVCACELYIPPWATIRRELELEEAIVELSLIYLCSSHHLRLNDG